MKKFIKTLILPLLLLLSVIPQVHAELSLADDKAILSIQQKIKTTAQKNLKKPITNFTGEIRTLLILTNSAKVKEVRILKSSGNKKLDNLVIKTIKQSQPFHIKFPSDIEQLRIIRSCYFKNGVFIDYRIGDD